MLITDKDKKELATMDIVRLEEFAKLIRGVINSPTFYCLTEDAQIWFKEIVQLANEELQFRSETYCTF